MNYCKANSSETDCAADVESLKDFTSKTCIKCSTGVLKVRNFENESNIFLDQYGQDVHNDFYIYKRYPEATCGVTPASPVTDCLYYTTADVCIKCNPGFRL